MLRTLVCTVVAGQLLGLLITVPRSNVPPIPSPAESRGENACQSEDSPHQESPLCIEDRTMVIRLMQEGEHLIEANQVVPIQELLQPAGPRRCWLDVPKPAPHPMDKAALYSYACRSVVVVAGFYRCPKCAQWHATTATGFAIAGNAVVTNYHVVNSPSKYTLMAMTYDGRVLPIRRLLAVDDVNDLAVLDVGVDDLQPLPLSNSREPAEVGTSVNVISHPAGHFYYFSTGVVSRHMRMTNSSKTLDAIAITADYARGSSGAPVLNDQGRVVGIACSTDSVYYRESEGRQENLQMVFKSCVPSRCLLELIEAPSPAEAVSTGFDNAGPKGETAAEGAEP